MARVQLAIDDPAERLTLRAILEAEGHRIVETSPDVLITDDARDAAERVQTQPTLVLAAASGIPEAVAAMRKGVCGYLFVPFQPGEAGIMVERAAATAEPTGLARKADTVGTDKDAQADLTLAEVEERHILATLHHCRNNRAKAARILGIGRNTLWRKLKRMHEAVPRDAR